MDETGEEREPDLRRRIGLLSGPLWLVAFLVVVPLLLVAVPTVLFVLLAPLRAWLGLPIVFGVEFGVVPGWAVGL